MKYTNINNYYIKKLNFLYKYDYFFNIFHIKNKVKIYRIY